MHRFISVEASSVLLENPAQAVPSATGMRAPLSSEQASTQPHITAALSVHNPAASTAALSAQEALM